MILIFLIIIIVLIGFILPWIDIINAISRNTNENDSEPESIQDNKPIPSENIYFNLFQLDLCIDNYSIYLLASARHTSPIKPRRFIHPALRNGYRYYQYIIIKDDLDHIFANKKPQYNFRTYDDGSDDFFEYTTNLILTPRMLNLSSQSSKSDNYYFYSKMHLIQVYHDEKKKLIREIHMIFLKVGNK